MSKTGEYPHPNPPPSYDNSQQGPPYPHQAMHPHAQPMHHQHQPMHHQPPMHMHHHQPVIVEQPTTIVLAPNVGPDPTMIHCRTCNNTVVTRMELEPTIRTHLCAGLLCLIGCWVCCCIPYCIASCQATQHYCPSCGTYVGTYKSY